MYETVLVPTDGSDSAMRAAKYGVALAESYGATVHVLSVVDERDYSTEVVDEEKIVQEGEAAGEREAKRAVDAVADRVADIDVTTHIEVGIPHETILEFVKKTGIDTVVMGTHGRTGLERFIIGSVAERVVRVAPVPVLTVRETELTPTWPPKTVLFPTDGSEASFQALPYALDLAEQFDAEINGIYVVDERTKSGYYNVGTALEDVFGGLQTRAEKATDRVRDEASESDVDVKTEIVEGLPSKTICERADKSDANIIVMSTHGRTGLEHFLLGSVTERVVRNSKTPVLSTPVPTTDFQ